MLIEKKLAHQVEKERKANYVDKMGFQHLLQEYILTTSKRDIKD